MIVLNKLLHLLQRLVKHGREFPCNYKNFGFRIACWIFFDRLFFVGRKQCYQRAIYSYIQAFLSPIITKYVSYKCNFSKEVANKPIPIWFCWLQGKKRMPELVEKCFTQLKKNIPNDIVEIRFISYYNIDDYIQLPNYIYEKHKSGIISPAHFSDIVRFSLLSEYGGLWIDSTIYTTRNIDPKCFTSVFYTLKMPQHLCPKEPCQGKWAGFLLGGSKEFPLFSYMRDSLLYYWQKHDKAVDYIFFDYIIMVAYENIPHIKQQIDKVPYNNENLWFLWKNVETPYSQELWNNIFSQNTFYKLSHQILPNKNTDDNRPTIWGKIMN